MEFATDTRLMSLTTPLGEDALLLRRLRAREAVSDLFHFEAEVLSSRPDLDFGSIIGKAVTANDTNGLFCSRATLAAVP